MAKWMMGALRLDQKKGIIAFKVAQGQLPLLVIANLRKGLPQPMPGYTLVIHAHGAGYEAFRWRDLCEYGEEYEEDEYEEG